MGFVQKLYFSNTILTDILLLKQTTTKRVNCSGRNKGVLHTGLSCCYPIFLQLRMPFETISLAQLSNWILRRWSVLSKAHHHTSTIHSQDTFLISFWVIPKGGLYLLTGYNDPFIHYISFSITLGRYYLMSSQSLSLTARLMDSDWISSLCN